MIIVMTDTTGEALCDPEEMDEYAVVELNKELKTKKSENRYVPLDKNDKPNMCWYNRLTQWKRLKEKIECDKKDCKYYNTFDKNNLLVRHYRCLSSGYRYYRPPKQSIIISKPVIDMSITEKIDYEYWIVIKNNDNDVALKADDKNSALESAKIHIAENRQVYILECRKMKMKISIELE